MTTSLRRRTLAAVFSSGLVAAGMVLPPTAAAHPTSVHAPCLTKDGTASGGQRVGDNPPRFKSGGSPYLGVRYTWCGTDTDTITVYYGGFTPQGTALEYYNIRDDLGQREYPPGAARLTTIRTGGLSRVWHFSVQHCARATQGARSLCTPWSPQVSVLSATDAEYDRGHADGVKKGTEKAKEQSCKDGGPITAPPNASRYHQGWYAGFDKGWTSTCGT
ncbi:hypothetical protein ABZ924_06445 [Streptomyces sp. NPDC046876]|uniref:hypothetical protein n=1 Tax=Streptomyces sp. NPDC046876 TaxID=3155616 RepID=UPI0033E5B228